MHLDGSRRHVQTRKFQKLEATGFAVPTDYHYMIGKKLNLMCSHHGKRCACKLFLQEQLQAFHKILWLWLACSLRVLSFSATSTAKIYAISVFAWKINNHMVRKPSAVVKHTPGNKCVRAGTKTVPAGTATLMQLVRSMLELVRNVAGKETCSRWSVIQKIPAGRSKKLLDLVKIQLLNNLPRLVKTQLVRKVRSGW